MAKEKTAVPVETKYSKEQLLRLTVYADRKVLLSVLLKDGETYTKAEADTLLNNYLKGVVK